MNESFLEVRNLSYNANLMRLTTNKDDKVDAHWSEFYWAACWSIWRMCALSASSTSGLKGSLAHPQTGSTVICRVSATAMMAIQSEPCMLHGHHSKPAGKWSHMAKTYRLLLAFDSSGSPFMPPEILMSTLVSLKPPINLASRGGSVGRCLMPSGGA